MRIELNCAKCGGNRFSIEKYSADDTRIKCEDCEHEVGTLAELKERVAAEVLSRAAGKAPQRD